MLELFVFILACSGLTQILVYGHIFNRIRPKYYFFNCPMCIGFWVGVAMFLMFWFSGIALFPQLWVGLLVFGCISSFVSYATSMVITDNGFQLGGWGNR